VHAYQHALEGGALRSGESECTHQQSKRVAPRSSAFAALPPADAADAQPGKLGKLLLRQAGVAAMSSQRFTEGVRFVDLRFEWSLKRGFR